MSDNEKYFDDAREMFATAGWKSFMAEVQQAIISSRVENIDSADKFWMMKGELAAYHRIAGYEDMLRQAEQQAEEITDESFE